MIKRFLWNVALAAGLCACAEPGGPLVEATADLDRAMARWDSANVSSYAFTFRYSCFCPPQVSQEVRITVRHDSVISVLDTAGVAVDTTWYRNYLTVDRMFASIRITIGNVPDSISASYDAQLGYPTHISVDPSRQTVDEEFAFRVTAFQVAAASSALMPAPR